MKVAYPSFDGSSLKLANGDVIRDCAIRLVYDGISVLYALNRSWRMLLIEQGNSWSVSGRSFISVIKYGDRKFGVLAIHPQSMADAIRASSELVPS